ncbi:MAG: ATP-binding cassette domain-containing protein [Caulobacteraceae bacterium]
MIFVDIHKRLRYFDMNIQFKSSNEVLIIQGPSGSGKTTILNCIAGIDQPDAGSVIINDTVVYSSDDKVNLPVKNRNIGYVFQDYALFPHMTVKDNILFGAKSKGIKNSDYCEVLMDKFKIKHLEKRYPSRISGGEKQRVALARALCAKPELLLLDEPFSALDADIKEKLYSEFIDLKKTLDIGVILITHNDEEAKLLGDRIIKIRDGQIK